MEWRQYLSIGLSILLLVVGLAITWILGYYISFGLMTILGPLGIIISIPINFVLGYYIVVCYIEIIEFISELY